MAKGKKPAPQEPQQTQAERDAQIDSHYADRITGGDDEGAAWAKAFGGTNVQESEQPDDAPLSDEEKAAVAELMFHARETDDAEGLEKLKQLADNPAELRKVMASFDAGS